MRRSILLVLSVALAVLVFAPVAAAHSDDSGADDRGMNAQGTDDRGFDDRGMHNRRADDRGFDDRGVNNRGVDDSAAASPASSASASATASAPATASSISSATSSSSPSSELPDTSGVSLIPMLLAAVLTLVICSGAVVTILVRRAS